MIKYFLIILILVPSFLFAKAESPTLMLQLTGKNIKLSEGVKLVIRMGVEEVLTEKGYMLVSESNQKMALEEMSKQSKSECLDDTCLVDTGGMLAAKGIFIVEIVKLGEKFVFKVKNIDIETAAVLKTKSMVYKGKLDDADKLLPFSKDLTSKIFKKHELATVKVEKNDDGCNEKTPKKCFELANTYKDGDGVPKSIYKANEYYKKSCDFKNSEACLALGDNYFEGNGFKINMKKAAKLYEQSCKLKNGLGCGKFGKIHFYGAKGIPRDLAKGNKYYEKSCDLKLAKACLYLGISYSKGLGVKKDLDRTFSLYSKACKLDKSFCKGLKPLLKKINKKKFIRDTCTVKTPEKCYEIAKNYELGKSEKQDYGIANTLYSRLCNLKYGKACNSLGYNYKYGVGVSISLPKAVLLYTKACDANDKYGCLNAGKSYLNGVGVKKDKKKVFIYYKKACSLGAKDKICKHFKN